MAVPDFVTVTFQFSACDTTVVDHRIFQIWDQNAIDRHTAPYCDIPLRAVQLAKTINRYEYDTEVGKQLHCVLYDVSAAGGVSSTKAIFNCAVNKDAAYARPVEPTIQLVMIEDVSAESSYSVDLYLS